MNQTLRQKRYKGKNLRNNLLQQETGNHIDSNKYNQSHVILYNKYKSFVIF